MIQPATGIDTRCNAGLRHLVLDAVRQFGRARRRVAQAIEFLGESAKVVNRLRLCAAADDRQARVPVRRDGDDRRR